MYLAGLFQGYVQTQAVNTPSLRPAHVRAVGGRHELPVRDCPGRFPGGRGVRGVRRPMGTERPLPGRLPDAHGGCRRHGHRRLPHHVHGVTGHGAHGLGSDGHAGHRAAGGAGQLEQPGLGDQPLLHRSGSRIGGGAHRAADRPDQRNRLAAAVRSIVGRHSPLPLVKGEGRGEQGLPVRCRRHQRVRPLDRSRRRRAFLAGRRLQPVGERLLRGGDHLRSRAARQRPGPHLRGSGSDPADRRHSGRSGVLPGRAHGRHPGT